VSGRILAVVLAPRTDGPEAREFLRVVAALVGVGRGVDLVEAGAGVGALAAGAEADEEVERTLDALRAAEVLPRPVREAATAGLLAAAEAVLVLAPPGRPGVPAVLEVGPGRPAPSLADLARAGQVVRAVAPSAGG
jgi:hypothetical protein